MCRVDEWQQFNKEEGEQYTFQCTSLMLCPRRSPLAKLLPGFIERPSASLVPTPVSAEGPLGSEATTTATVSVVSLVVTAPTAHTHSLSAHQSISRPSVLPRT